MKYKIELRYIYGWDDAGWTEEIAGNSQPVRFSSPHEAQIELEEFFADVKQAVADGDMDSEECREDYRIRPI